MAEAVVGIVLDKLIPFAGREVGLFLGFDGDKKKLESMLTAMKATLQDAEEKQFSDRAIKDWLRKLKDVAYKLDDIMDECVYEALRSEHQGVKCGLSDAVQCSCLSFFDPKHLCFRYKIAKKMKRISERLKEIYDERTQFGFTLAVQERTKTSGVPEWRQTMSIITEPKVYGREEDTKKIVDSLIGASHFENLSVYPIVGLGGLGKTTLAQLIYKDERVVNHFDKKMWVCVSEDFSLTTIMKAIIKEASAKACQDSNLESLQKELQDLLQTKRYMLVLDDVWNEDQENWRRLKTVLACGAKGSSILVTTRLSNVATFMRTMPLHELSILSDNDAWELFKHQAFEPNEEEPMELVEIGKEIVNKCGGVPLAAKALGGLLRFKRNKNEWLNVLQSNVLELSQSENSIMPVLRLSYLNLAVKLRQCFAYCAIFPKDEKIEKQHLIELWVSNEFISSKGTLDAEDVGDDVWNELHWRSFFQDISTDEFGKVSHFKMHDLVHDLAQSVAEDVCCLISGKDVTALSERIHHVSDCKWMPGPVQLHQVKSLRTYIFLYNFWEKFYLDLHCVKLSPHVLKCYSLRVLQGEGIENLSSSIGDLKHLRYLNLSSGHFETLPESIGKLWNLQILKLDFCGRLGKLPNSLIRLKALQQLSLRCCWKLSSLPPGIGKLTSLRTLSTFIVGKERGCFLGELGPLNLKGGLHIKHLENVENVKDAKEALMSSKQLNELTLSWDSDQDNKLKEEILEALQPNTQQLHTLWVHGYKGAHFPQWMSSSHSLKKLEIYDMNNVKYVYEECYDGGLVFIALEFLIICNLPNLISISREDGENIFPRLSKLEISGCDKLDVSGGFQCLTSLEKLLIAKCREVKGLDEALQHMTALKSLHLSDLQKLESLPDCLGNLPLLLELSIERCPKLRCLPTSLRLSKLQDLDIRMCSDELEKRCEKETGEDWPIIAHIPRIDIL